MKILVYGAGVLGSYLAHVLTSSGHNVTLLARGKRLEELRENGLVIRHYLQCKTTTDDIKLTETYRNDDAYDIVFVVMQRNQLDDVLPILCENEIETLLVLIGNNPTAELTQQYIQAHSKAHKRVVFAFQSTGGRREKGKVVSIHTGFSKLSGKMTAGSLDGDDSYQQTMPTRITKLPSAKTCRFGSKATPLLFFRSPLLVTTGKEA